MGAFPNIETVTYTNSQTRNKYLYVDHTNICGDRIRDTQQSIAQPTRQLSKSPNETERRDDLETCYFLALIPKMNTEILGNYRPYKLE